MNYIVWVDFGFFKSNHLKMGTEKYIPQRFLDYRKFDSEKVNYTVINPLCFEDFDIVYTLKNAPEKIAGYFFILRADIMIQYQSLYHSVLLEFNENGYADDDQHLVLRCFEKQPNFFNFLKLPWHTALVYFQFTEEISKAKLKILEILGWSRDENEKIIIIGNTSLNSSLNLSLNSSGNTSLNSSEILNCEMLTFLTFNLTMEQCKKLKNYFINCKIYNLIYRNSETVNTPGIISYSYEDENNLKNFMIKEFKYLNFDIKIIEKAILKQ
jgi:hypothetical protein